MSNLGTTHFTHLGNKANTIKLALIIVPILFSIQTAFAAETMPVGMKGWWYFRGMYTPGGYAGDPGEACQLTAQRHMGTNLLSIYPTESRKPNYACVYMNTAWPTYPQTLGLTYLVCLDGYIASWPGVCVKSEEIPSPPSCSGDTPGLAIGNPVVISTGAKVQTDIDIEATPAALLAISRTYRSYRKTGAGQSAGAGWSFSFDRDISVNGAEPGVRPSLITGALGDGSYIYFSTRSDGTFVSAYDKKATLRPVNDRYSEWIYTDANGTVDYHRIVDGKFLLVSSRTLNGIENHYTYNAENKLESIHDSHGRALHVKWHGTEIVAIESVDGGVHYEYEYVEKLTPDTGPIMGRLVGVTFIDKDGHPAGTKRYQYENNLNRYLLTGITDENGARFATYAYDDANRTILSEHAGGAYRYVFDYSATNAPVITDPLGSKHTITFPSRRSDYPARVIAESQPAGSGCSASASTRQYDSQGTTLLSSTDFNQRKTCYLVDTTRGLETSRVTGIQASTSCPASASAIIQTTARRISTKWHPDFPVQTGTATPNLITTLLYNGQRDTDGQVANCATGATLLDGKPIPVVCKKTLQPTSDNNGGMGFAASFTGRSRSWGYSYNAGGQLLNRTGPPDATGRTESSQHTYYASATSDHGLGDLATVTNAAGEVAQFLEYTEAGQIKKIRYSNGQFITFEYGLRKRLISVTVEDSMGNKLRTRYEYDSVGQLIRAIHPDRSVIMYTYDEAHRLTGFSDAIGNSVIITLDGMGNSIRQEIRDNSGKLVRQQIQTFDALNRLEKVQRDVSDPGNRFQYDSAGNLIKLIDSLGRVTNRNYDSFDRLTSQIFPPQAAGAPRPRLSYGYDHNDELTSVIDPSNRITKYTMDAFANRTATESPDTGIATVTFDDSGRVATRKDARSSIINYKYDPAGRIIEAGSIIFAYGKPGAFASGNLTEIHDDSGQTTYGYDGLGRVNLKTQTVTAGTVSTRLVTSYVFGDAGNDAGHVIAITYPSGNRVEYSHGPDGRVTAMALRHSLSAPPTYLLQAVSYSAFGPVQGWTWGNSTATAQNTYRRTFDSEGKLTSFPLGYPGKGGVVRTLAYDGAGRIVAATHTGIANSNAQNQQYTYDDLDRLVGYTAGQTVHTYGYDLNGNRVSSRFGATNFANIISPSNNRLVKTTGPAPPKNNLFDTSGNLIDDGTIKYTYNASGRMTRAAIGAAATKYSYNGKGARVAKIDATGKATYYFYDDNGQLLGEYDSTGRILQETVYLGDIPVAVLRPVVSGNLAYTVARPLVYYVYVDHLRTPRVITRETDNAMVWRWDGSDPFGMYAPEENPSSLGSFTYNLRFPGQIFDKETNSNYNYFRDYDPQTGRFLQSDPIGLAGGVNTYGYVGANPVNRIDPLGLDWIYHQSTGQIVHVDPQGNSDFSGQGYAGHNLGLNNPGYQNVPGGPSNSNGGPLPQGDYTIQPQQNNVTGNGTVLPGSMRLLPNQSNNMYGRAGFLIHGGNMTTKASSQGCIAMPTPVRNHIGNSGDDHLVVVP